MFNICLAIAIDGEQVDVKEYRDSQHAKTTYRIDTEQLRAALEHGQMEVTVVVDPLNSDD